ncbi:MAG: hypothetical protein ACLRWQ_12960 [Flavonifractor plautii]
MLTALRPLGRLEEPLLPPDRFPLRCSGQLSTWRGLRTAPDERMRMSG